MIKRVGDSMENALDIVMQELIGCLCGCHFWELKNHFSYPFGRRYDDGEALDFEKEDRRTVKHQQLYYQDLENHINELEACRYTELMKNDELRAQLKGKDKKIQELEELMKAQERKFKGQDKKFQNQERRVREKNKTIREQKEVIEFNEIEIEVEHDLVEKLRAEKRDLQEKTEALAEELKDYKVKLAEEGYTIVEEEVDAEE
jgi:DNA repair exonuclease SbcCD ATPase subunit